MVDDAVEHMHNLWLCMMSLFNGKLTWSHDSMTNTPRELCMRVQGEFGRPALIGGPSGTILPEGRVERMSTRSVEDLVQFWSNRLRSFRSGDHVDASTLLATPGGPGIMSLAIAAYLRGWAGSSWVDEAEIGFLAADLAGLWPHNSPLPELFHEARSEDPRYLAYAQLFMKAFSGGFRPAEDENLSDAIAAYGAVA